MRDCDYMLFIVGMILWMIDTTYDLYDMCFILRMINIKWNLDYGWSTLRVLVTTCDCADVWLLLCVVEMMCYFDYEWMWLGVIWITFDLYYMLLWL